MLDDINPYRARCSLSRTNRIFTTPPGTMTGLLIPRARPRGDLTRDDDSPPAVSRYISFAARLRVKRTHISRDPRAAAVDIDPGVCT